MLAVSTQVFSDNLSGLYNLGLRGEMMPSLISNQAFVILVLRAIMNIPLLTMLTCTPLRRARQNTFRTD